MSTFVTFIGESEEELEEGCEGLQEAFGDQEGLLLKLLSCWTHLRSRPHPLGGVTWEPWSSA